MYSALRWCPSSEVTVLRRNISPRVDGAKHYCSKIFLDRSARTATSSTLELFRFVTILKLILPTTRPDYCLFPRTNSGELPAHSETLLQKLKKARKHFWKIFGFYDTS